MKTLLCFLALASFTFAAAPVVTIDDNFNAIVDGSNFGKAGDTIVNHKANAELVVAVNLALTAKLTALKAAANASVAAANAQRDTAIAAKETEKQTAIAAAQAQRNTAIAAAQALRDAAIAAKNAEVTRVAAIVAALKASELIAPLPPVVAEAIVSEEAKQKAALLAQKAALEAKLAAMP